MHFEIAVDISAPPEVVWSVMSDAEKWHEWTPSVTSIRLLGGAPLRVGSRALIRQPKFPPAVWKVTRLEPDRGFVWTSGFPGMRVHAHHSLDVLATGTRVRLRLDYEGALGRLMARMTRDITNRYLEYEANELKQRSEELSQRRARR
jgi:hypothetical protein